MSPRRSLIFTLALSLLLTSIVAIATASYSYRGVIRAPSNI